ncbi:lipoprotein [Denitratisoma sp. agr-D3]
MRVRVLGTMLIAASLSVGCSTITQSENQSLALTATYEGKPVEPVCQIKNDKGSWDSKAPANVTVRKSGEDLEVTCKKDGMPDGLLKAISRAAGSMWGNIVFGGGIGAIIDHNKGTGYDYPDQLQVKMGESVVVDKKPSTQPTQTAQTN